jgi:hypothetical protein
MRLLIAFLAFFISVHVKAEYRAFELAITNVETQQSRKVTTVFDHLQYPQYNYVASNEVVTIQASWMCWQRSDYFRAICPNPATLKKLPGVAGPGSNSGAANRSPASL